MEIDFTQVYEILLLFWQKSIIQVCVAKEKSCSYICLILLTVYLTLLLILLSTLSQHENIHSVWYLFLCYQQYICIKYEFDISKLPDSLISTNKFFYLNVWYNILLILVYRLFITIWHTGYKNINHLSYFTFSFFWSHPCIWV